MTAPKHRSRVTKDPVTGEHVIVLPEELLREAGWDETTPLKWVVENDQVSIQRTRKAPKNKP